MTTPLPQAVVYDAWLVVPAVDEFELYPTKEAAADRDDSCIVSGALPRQKQDALAKRYRGRIARVKAYGILKPWAVPAPEPGMVPTGLWLIHEGSYIQNLCGREYVLLASGVEPSR